MGATKRQIDALSPLLEGSGPSDDGEWNMHCPYHGDSKRSASFNVEKGLWNCHGCGESGSVSELLKDKENWNFDESLAREGGRRKTSNKGPEAIPSEATVAGWAARLQSEAGALAEFTQRKGLTAKTIADNEIGYDSSFDAYTIPVRDSAGDLVNVRRYQLDPTDDRRKIWSLRGHGTPALYPIDQLSANTIVVCEGEWDALMLIQNGIPAVTRTASALTWRKEWSHLFTGKRVVICHDMDEAGQAANERVALALKDFAASIVVVHLPYEVTKKNGKDIGDFFLEGATKADFVALMKKAKKITSRRDKESQEPRQISVGVMDSFDASLVHQALQMNVTVTGKKIPSYLVPKEVVFGCDLGAGKKCTVCAAQPHGGTYRYQIAPSDPIVLTMLGVTEDKVSGSLWKAAGLQKCNRWSMSQEAHMTVEEIYVRPSIEESSSAQPDFTHRRVISVGSHDLTANQTIRVVGTIRPDPKTQLNEFQAWSVTKPPSALDTFEMTEEIMQTLLPFQAGQGEDPLDRCYKIAKDMEDSVTLIKGREDMHVFIDLVFHSALEFDFGGEKIPRGWIDALIIGDTRTGKSEAAGRMTEHYGLGEMISCESASFAGVVGGLDRLGDGKWIVKWGAIPVNDRRIVTMDEVSGLQCEQIAQMSSIRSTGVAELTKIANERASARTRLLWLANPRNARMDDYAFGVQAIQPLIGNPEDIARFDMAMGVFSSDVPVDLINVRHRGAKKSAYGREAYRDLLMWAWTRTAKDVKWSQGAVRETLRLATSLGGRYVDNPPLVQGANVRVKLARIATAIAMRTFSTTNGHNVIVTEAHAAAASEFLDSIYSKQNFGYAAISEQRHQDARATNKNIEKILATINSHGYLRRFLREYPKFNRLQMESALNISRESAQNIIAELWDLHAVSWADKDNVRVEPEVLAEIRQ